MAKREGLTTLCYIERDDEYLMLHRISKKNDLSKDKWLGVGGHFEDNESPEECIKREIFEESGYDIPLDEIAYRAIITFISDRGDYELMSLFTAKCPGGEPKECDEGKRRMYTALIFGRETRSSLSSWKKAISSFLLRWPMMLMTS